MSINRERFILRNCSCGCGGVSPKSAGWTGRLETQGKEAVNPSAAKFLLALGRSVFVLLRPSADWMRPTHIREGNLLYSKHQFHVNPLISMSISSK